jgi:hypothetical protein
MARDIGFLGCQMGEQIFSPRIDEADFGAVVEEFGLGIRRHDMEPSEAVLSFLNKTIRRDHLVNEGHVPWYHIQAQRFRQMAPVVQRFAGLAQDLPGGARTSMFRGFRVAAESEADWPFSGGWG